MYNVRLTTVFSIGYSPNGWTDTELSLQWLEKVFIPYARAKHESGSTVILQLDGHKSHTTYQFASMCAKNSIELVLSPSHTTHRLQPCDVAVFSPLANAYKKVISDASMKGTRINKRTLPSLYARARTEAYKPGTIKTAFRKAGIWPLDRNIIEDKAYEPSKNTSNQASMPIPVAQPDILVAVTKESSASGPPSTQLPDMVVPINANASPPHIPTNTVNIPVDNISDNGTPVLVSGGPEVIDYRFVGLIPPSRRNATLETLKKENHQLRQLLEQAKVQIQADHALKVLMEGENAKLREELHGKKKVERKRAPGEGQARLLTSDEQLDALALYDWKKSIEAVHNSKQAKTIFKERRELIRLDEDNRAELIRKASRTKALELKAAVRQEKQLAATLQRAQKADKRREEKERNRIAREEEKLKEKARKLDAKLKVTKTRKPSGYKCSGKAYVHTEERDSTATASETKPPLEAQNSGAQLEDPLSRENQGACSNSRCEVEKLGEYTLAD